MMVICAASSQLAQAQQSFAPPLANVPQGKLEGKEVGGGISVFFGIPFASPPVGDLRWQPPQPPQPWDGVRSAVSYGAPCAQNDPSFGGLFDKVSREDCLYLNVWTPNLKPKAPMPVLVYIHGGALVGGAGSIPTFDGAAFARKGVILVTINYRLGIFGFFSHPELTAQSGQHASGNYGLADQIAALRWVKQNIAAFGGDPSQVTISGQSAGSASVLMLMTSPRAKGLFQRAIAESGTPLLVDPWMSRSEAEHLGADFAASVNVKSIGELRRLPPADLMTPWRKFLMSKGMGLMRLTVDGSVLDRSPSEVFAKHREMRVPLLTGNNSREGLDVPSDTELLGSLGKTFGASANRAKTIYAAAEADPVLGSATARYATDVSFRCPAVMIQRMHAQQGSPTFAYQFEEPLPAHKTMGSQHSDEVPFVFSTLRMMIFGAPVPKELQTLSDTMSSYWANFAKSGNPNGAGLPDWPRFAPGVGQYVHLSASGVRADSKLAREACDLYETSVLPRLITPVAASVGN
jgi:para-nitrobenzyl esterase